MNKINLTDEKVRKLKPTEVEQIIWDQQISGLGVRVTPAGKKSFVLKFRVGGLSKKPTLGACGPGALSVAEARAIAVSWKSSAQQGLDPTRARQQERSAPTMNDLCDEYVRRHGSRKRSGFEDQRKIDVVIKPRIGALRVKDVSQLDVEALHRGMKDRPYEGNRVLALLSKMFSLAEKWGWREGNPAQGVEKFAEEKRERFLSRDELVRLDSALTAYAEERGDLTAQDAADAIRLLLLTGCRSGELLSATWSQFDLEKAMWTKPSSHTKTKKVHRVTLSAPAVALLNGLWQRREVPNRYVFPGTGDQHRKSLKAAWSDIRIRAGIEDVRIHDLRHTSASLMLSAGVPLDIVGRVLGHTQAQTTLRYAHLSDEAGKAATDALGKVIAFGEKEA